MALMGGLSKEQRGEINLEEFLKVGKFCIVSTKPRYLVRLCTPVAHQIAKLTPFTVVDLAPQKEDQIQQANEETITQSKAVLCKCQ